MSFSEEQEALNQEDTVETVVGPSVHVEGDFASEGNIVVKGSVSGNVQTTRQLTVVEGAKILANVKAGFAIVSGHIKGNVRVDDRLELTESAQILGDISCATLVVAPGALIHGKVAMKGVTIEDPKNEKTRGLRRTRIKAEDEETEEDVVQ